MKMDTADKASLLGGIFLLLIMLIQMYANYRYESNFNEYSLKTIETAKKDFVDAGFSETQATAISYRIHDEVFLLKSTVFSQGMTQSTVTFFASLIVLMLSLSALKKMNKNN